MSVHEHVQYTNGSEASSTGRYRHRWISRPTAGARALQPLRGLRGRTRQLPSTNIARSGM